MLMRHRSHNINLFYEGSPITGTSPFQTNPAPYAEIVGDSNRTDAVAGDDYVIKMSSINCKVQDFKFAVKGPASFGSTGMLVMELVRESDGISS
jgi:hypothetical protein